MYRSFDRTKVLSHRLLAFPKNKSLRKVKAHIWCPPSSYNPDRAASPPLLSLTLTLSPVTVFLDSICDFWLSLSSFLSIFSLLSLPASSFLP